MFDIHETIQTITNPTKPLDQALVMAQRMMRVESMFDVLLAQRLPRFDDPGSMDMANAERALQVLDIISPGPRLVLSLGHLMQHPNERLRSKAALLLAKRVQNLRWSEKHFQEADPRVRANIIEALWKSTAPGTSELLWEAIDDKHHRVAVNAALGLYFAKDSEASRLLIGLSFHSSVDFRLAAVWGMGLTRDALFLEALTARLRDEQAKVKNLALRMIMEIKRNANS